MAVTAPAVLELAARGRRTARSDLVTPGSSGRLIDSSAVVPTRRGGGEPHQDVPAGEVAGGGRRGR